MTDLPQDLEEAAYVAQQNAHKALLRAGLIVAGFVILAGFIVLVSSVQKSNTDKELAKRDNQLAALANTLDRVSLQLESLTGVKQPSAEEILNEPILGPEGPQGEQGPGPTAAQVQEAITIYLRANPPEPGRAPTDAEIAAAVALFCAANGGCRGEPGVQGQTGSEGPQGEQGPGPTDEQVAAAVTAFCAANGGCLGPVGPPGPAPTGPFVCTGQVTDFNVITGEGTYNATCNTTTTTTTP